MQIYSSEQVELPTAADAPGVWQTWHALALDTHTRGLCDSYFILFVYQVSWKRVKKTQICQIYPSRPPLYVEISDSLRTSCSGWQFNRMKVKSESEKFHNYYKRITWFPLTQNITSVLTISTIVLLSLVASSLNKISSIKYDIIVFPHEDHMSYLNIYG